MSDDRFKDFAKLFLARTPSSNSKIKSSGSNASQIAEQEGLKSSSQNAAYDRSINYENQFPNTGSTGKSASGSKLANGLAVVFFIGMFVMSGIFAPGLLQGFHAIFVLMIMLVAAIICAVVLESIFSSKAKERLDARQKPVVRKQGPLNIESISDSSDEL